MNDFDALMTAEDWKAMYLLLFHGTTDALELMPAEATGARACLLRASREAEDYYLRQGDGPIDEVGKI